MSTPTAAPAPTAAPPRLSIEEFIARHGNSPRVELVKGIVKEYPMPGLEHGKICAKIGALIFNHVEARDLGHVMSNDSFVRTGPDSVRGADVLFYSYERLPKGQPIPKTMHERPPDLVVEVKSPSDNWTELFGKVVEYLRAGVRVVLLLDPESASASVYQPNELRRILHNGDELTLPEVLPGFAVAVSRLFA